MTECERRYLREAEGWLELGDHASAFAALDQINPALRAAPEVLRLRWRVYNHAGRHGNAFVVAECLARQSPTDVEAAVWRSYSARRMAGGSVALAFELLHKVTDKFPNEPLVPFNLACYCAQMKRLDHAKAWLHTAFEVAERNGTQKQWKQVALDEPDLAVFFGECRELE